MEANLIMTDKADSSFLEQTFMKKFSPEQITTSAAKNLDCQLEQLLLHYLIVPLGL
jgi:hypothetical protein